MKVILLKQVAQVGNMHDVVDVANGYALNFLIPQKLARTATPAALNEVEARRKEMEEKQEVEMQKRDAAIEKLSGKALTLKERANEEGHLFAGVHKGRVAEALKDTFDVSLSPEVLSCPDPIKEVGEYEITITGSEGVSGVVTLTIEAEDSSEQGKK